MRFLLLSAALVTALAFAACGDDDEQVDDDNSSGSTLAATATDDSGAIHENIIIELVAADFQFGPTVIPFATPGTGQIHFTNTGQAKHSFTIDELDVSEDIDPNTDHTFDFEVPDHTVEFYCRFHPDTMKGTITIDGGTEVSPSATDDDDSGGGGGYGY